MPRPCPRREQDDVDADVVARPGIARHEIFRRRRDPGEPPLVDREVEFGRRRPRLHLDERDEIALLRHPDDLAGRGAYAPVEDAPALEPQPPAGEPHAAPAGSFSHAAIPQDSPPWKEGAGGGLLARERRARPI